MNTVPDVQPTPWRDFCWDGPYGKVPPNEEIEVLRNEWNAPHRIRLCDMHPAMNVADLYWRRIT